jgi:hypothetical protein
VIDEEVQRHRFKSCKLQYPSVEHLKITNALDDSIKTLYHYQKYDKVHLIDVLQTRRAFCSNLGNINDPWDCTISFKIDTPESVMRTVSALKKTAIPSKHGPHIDRFMDEALGNDPRLLKIATDMTAESLQADNVQWRRLYCLTPCITSTLMWSHYAENHKGIGLEFAVKPDNVFATAFKVFYEEEFLPFELYRAEGLALLPFLIKAHCWRYEEEYRLFLRIHEPDALHPFPDCMHVEDDRFKLPADSLAAIVLGCRTPNETAIEIQQLVAEHWPEVRLKKMFQHRDRYELEIRDFDPT